jgi:23S rRNA (guanosine2251-2'-O)-methyltransferase
MKRDVRILLHDIRSVHNVGAIFRTADAIGASRIYLSGFSPTPLDRFGNLRSDMAKSALGSEKSVAWEYIKDPIALIESLKKEGFQAIALEQDPKSKDYKDIEIGERALAIFGTETTGISKEMLALADAVAEIPMRGMKESLNVSVSAGIALFRWFDRA